MKKNLPTISAVLYSSKTLANGEQKYCKGDGVSQDYNKGVEFFQKAANLGHMKRLTYVIVEHLS